MAAPELNPDALTDVEAFLAHLGEPTDKSGKNRDRAVRLINSYSTAAAKYMRRQFKPVENGVEKIFAYTGNGYLSLAPYEARAITTVTTLTDLPEASWVVLNNQSPTQEAQWRANPRNKTQEGTYYALTLPETGIFHPYYDFPITLLNRRNLEYEVTILGDWGVGTVPSDVEMAIWISCANAWRNPEAFGHRQLGPLMVSGGMDPVPGGDSEGLSLPRAARALLNGYRRKTFAV